MFRTRIDLMQLDVTVLDKQGQPVRGLTQADFTLLEDNKPQTIDGFTAVDVPDVSTLPPPPVWKKTVPNDVATNEIDSNQRIFVLVLDDGAGQPDLWAKRELKKAAESFIDKLGPADLAAVVFSGTAYPSSQNLTGDHARLVNAVRAYPDNDANMLLALRIPRGEIQSQTGVQFCNADKQLLKAMKAIIDQLGAVPDRRKSILYFGGNPPWAAHPTANVCGTYWLWQEVFVAAQRAHVTVNPIDTMGFKDRPGRPGSGLAHAYDVFLTVAHETGGRAIINTNDFEPGMRQILVENSSYYLLAYQSTNDIEDGTSRRITVKVARPDVEVIARRNYWAPRATPVGEPAPPPPSPAIEAMAGLLPLSKLALRATAAPFAIPGSDASVLTLALGVKQPAFASRTPEQVDVLIKAFSADGDPKGTETQMIPITVPAARLDTDISRYEVLARIELPKPGKYEVRLSAHSSASDTSGSVYVDVEVPDFRKDKVSLSGVVLNNALPPAPIAPVRALRDIVPIVPTTERAFATTDIVTAFLRVYQGGSGALASTTLKVTIVDAAGKSVFEQADTLAADRFGAERSADYQLRLPLATLTTGEYLLTFEATSGKVTARRDVRFQVR